MTEKYKFIGELYRYCPEEWKSLFKDYDQTKKAISHVSRELPPDVYEFIREHMIDQLFFNENKQSAPQLKFVVDSNIIVKDAFRVGSGKFSSTERIFSSPFVKLYAPRKIEDEVYEQITRDLPEKCSMDLALEQARRLLSKIEIIDDNELNVENSQLSEFRDKYDNDAHFLKVGIGLEIDKIISRDKKAFNGISTMKRYELGTAVELIVSVEAGSLSLSIVTGTAFIGAEAIYFLLSILYKIFTDLLLFIISIVTVGISGFITLLGKLPAWVWYIAIGSIFGTIIAFAFSKNLRSQAVNIVDDLSEWINTHSIYAKDALISLIKGTVDLSTMLKEDLGPYFINTGSVIVSSIYDMVDILNKES